MVNIWQISAWCCDHHCCHQLPQESLDHSHRLTSGGRVTSQKQRLAEEEAARKKAEAAGPALEDIPPDELLAHIESIREIMEFSDVEKEIRVMCEQSSIPQALVDIAVSEPDKLDQLEKEAQG